MYTIIVHSYIYVSVFDIHSNGASFSSSINLQVLLLTSILYITQWVLATPTLIGTWYYEYH